MRKMLPPHRYALTRHPDGDYAIIRLGKGARTIKRFPSLTAAIKAYKAGLKAYDDWKTAQKPSNDPANDNTIHDEPPDDAHGLIHDQALSRDFTGPYDPDQIPF